MQPSKEYTRKGSYISSAPICFRTIPFVLKQALDESYRMMETPVGDAADRFEQPELFAFLLCWDILLGFMSKVAPDQRPKYSTALTEPLDRLMLTLFTVMPERPFSRLSREPFGDLLSSFTDTPDPLADGDIFTKHPVFPHSRKV